MLAYDCGLIIGPSIGQRGFFNLKKGLRSHQKSSSVAISTYGQKISRHT